MKTKLPILCCLATLWLAPQVRAQEEPRDPGIQNSTSSTENPTVLNGVQSTVNYYDGTVQVQIPLYTLAEFGMQVPVALTYRTTGIRIEDKASHVGLGWNLSAGGKVTRMVRRNPDENEGEKTRLFTVIFDQSGNPLLFGMPPYYDRGYMYRWENRGRLHEPDRSLDAVNRLYSSG